VASDPGAAFGPAIGGGGSGLSLGGVVLGSGGSNDMFATNTSGGHLGDGFSSGDGASGFGGFKSARSIKAELGNFDCYSSVPNRQQNCVVTRFLFRFSL